MIAACTFGMLAGRPLEPPTTPDYVAEQDWTSRTFDEVFESMVRVLESLPERAWSISYQRTRLLTPQEAHLHCLLRSWGKTNAIRQALGRWRPRP
jgi:hypothetical protein